MKSISNPHWRCRSLAAVAALACLLPLAGARAAAHPTGDDIVGRMDKALTSARDQYFEYKLATYEPGKPPRVLTFSVHIMGDKYRRIEFMAPGDVKGTRFLVLDVDQMYVYMPAYKKVRRVASHVKSQGFMGSAYSQDEMSVVTYGDIYAAKYVDEDADTYHLEMTRRPGQTFPYPKMEMWVRKDSYQPQKLIYYNDKGVKQKTENRESFQCKENTCNPRIMTLIDHSRGDLKSVMVQQAWKLNTGVDERFFTVRSLQRRR